MSEGRRAADQYDAMGEAYARDTAEHPYNAMYERPATLALAGDVSDRDVLELGCASGTLTRQLVTQGARVTACDISPRMVELARESIGDAAQLLVADLADPLPFADASFDTVIASLVLHYLEHWEPVLAEFARVLRPGGSVVISTHHPANDWEYSPDDYFAKQVIVDTWVKGGTPFEVTFWRRPLTDMTTAFAASGFVIEQLVEPAPLPALREQDPDVFAKLTTRPTFLFFRLTRG